MSASATQGGHITEAVQHITEVSYHTFKIDSYYRLKPVHDKLEAIIAVPQISVEQNQLVGRSSPYCEDM